MAFSISDSEKAWEIAYEKVPAPVELLLGDGGTNFYLDGKVTNLTVLYSDDIALLEDGTPVVIRIPDPGGRTFSWHPTYNPDAVEAVRQTVFEEAYKYIHIAKWNNTPWDQRTAEEITEQEGTPIEVEAQQASVTKEECLRQWCSDILARSQNRWYRGMFRCLCQQPDCPFLRGYGRHNPVSDTPEQFELNQAASADFRALAEKQGIT